MVYWTDGIPLLPNLVNKPNSNGRVVPVRNLRTHQEIVSFKIIRALRILSAVHIPVLLPGLVAMLQKAKENNCFEPDSFSFALHFHLERKQFRFNGHDFLTLYLYQRRRTKSNEIPVKQLSDIPWVAKEWAVRQRPPLPLNLQWTEE
ncbi:hypothetical protein X801_09201 [Opisthorchis viverrini]|uniref:Uncharacterized protein n=1 Tax=Opisthorchis viverrini TaxID=6198 RepID=A0A1S8WKN5_OPIVI|nr:hypothetical protein X801_09201 [Opisthorchis viverrini]